MWKLERIGLLVVFASLLVIASTVLLLFQNQQDARITGIRDQGVGVARILTRVPFDEIARGGQQQGIVQLLHHTVSHGDFAYSSVVDTDGRSVYEYSSDGIIAPPALLPDSPATWLGQRDLSLPVNGRRIIEFHAPLFQDGTLRGFARIGYFYPSFGLTVDQLPFVATVALPIFLLVPLFYFLLRHEVRPIRNANVEISKILSEDNFGPSELTVSPELGDFMQRFNQFVALAKGRIESLENDRTQLLTSSKLVSYRKNRIESVLETLPEAVMVLDETGTVTFANEKVAALFGTNSETIMNRHPHEWCDNPDVLSMFGKFEQQRTLHSLTDTMRFMSGSIAEKNYATKTYPLFSPKDPSVAIGTLVVFRDETHEALARQARSDFVAHLSHELKSPLNVLGLYSESLLGEAGHSEEFRIEAANAIAVEVQQLSTLINGLLNMTQIESGSLVPDRTLVKLRDVLSSVFEEATRSAKDRDITMNIDIPKELCPIKVDKDLLRIAISNLLTNAVKYNRSGGSVTLSTEETADAVQIRVRDTGIGISEEDQTRVFEKFFRSGDQAVTSQNGHGLGLALARQIIDLHHGALTFESEVGTGTEFLITLWKDSTSARQAI